MIKQVLTFVLFIVLAATFGVLAAKTGNALPIAFTGIWAFLAGWRLCLTVETLIDAMHS